MSLEGRVAIVTGAGGQGMGRSIAITLARDGADIVVNWRRSKEPAEQTAAAIRDLGRKAILAQGDVGEPDDVDTIFAEAAAAFGRVDIVINSAGGPWKPQDVTDITPDHLRRVLAAEIEATYYLLRAALPGMRARRWGRFVSIGGHMADDWRFGPPEAPLDYPLGKAARHWLTRTIAPREAANGITVNAVAPGPTRHFDAREARAAVDAGLSDDGNTPQHVAEVVAFLCSNEAARITGAVIPLPGARPL